MSSPAYFEVCWAVFSTICLTNILFGILVGEITSFTLLLSVPIVTSAAGAVANGLCYYVYYASHLTLNRVIAAVFADLFWLFQEAGILFYSYIILRRMLRDRRWLIFSAAFWSLLTATTVTRVCIAIFRVRFIRQGDAKDEVIINYLHTGYFTLMATSECISAYFLVSHFASARDTSLAAALRVGLLRYLTRSTEFRVAVLAVIGVTRTIIHPFQTPGQRADNVGSQLDRFLYALFCLYPVVLYIDGLATKIRHAAEIHEAKSNCQIALHEQPRSVALDKRDRYSVARCEHITRVCSDITPNRSSSQEGIVRPTSAQTEVSESGVQGDKD